MSEPDEDGHTARIRFSPVHRGGQGEDHVDANKRVDGEKVDDKSGHHQAQSPGYGKEKEDIPVRRRGSRRGNGGSGGSDYISDADLAGRAMQRRQAETRRRRF
jgi:hypothetical protein